MVCQKPTLTHCRAQTNVHNSCVPRTWRRQASGQITRSAVPGIATRFPFFANRKIRNGRTFSRRASTHALTLQANGLYNYCETGELVSDKTQEAVQMDVFLYIYIYKSIDPKTILWRCNTKHLLNRDVMHCEMHILLIMWYVNVVM